eukprot:scaffold3500_cov56-Phaeocystis_antarctica.AAC.3
MQTSLTEPVLDEPALDEPTPPCLCVSTTRSTGSQEATVKPLLCVACRGEARRRRGEARHAQVRRGKVRQGEAGQGKGRQGEARRGEARRGKAPHLFHAEQLADEAVAVQERVVDGMRPLTRRVVQAYRHGVARKHHLVGRSFEQRQRHRLELQQIRRCARGRHR